VSDAFFLLICLSQESIIPVILSFYTGPQWSTAHSRTGIAASGCRLDSKLLRQGQEPCYGSCC